MKKVKLTHLETFLLPFWSINYKRRDSLCVRFPNSQFSSRKSCVHPSQGVRPFIINHLDWCSKENILIWLGKIFFLDELFILFVHAVWRLEWEMSPSLIFHCVVPIGGANCKVPEPWGAEPCWRRRISGEGLEVSQSGPSCIHSLLPSPRHLPLWGWNRSSLIPVSACMHSCFFSHDGLPPSGTIRKNKTFLSYTVLAMVFYQSNRKRK